MADSNGGKQSKSKEQWNKKPEVLNSKLALNELNSNPDAPHDTKETNPESNIRINFTPVLESYLAWNVLSLTTDIQSKIEDPVFRQQAVPTDIVSADFLTSVTGCSSEACLDEWLESNSDEPETAQLVDLVKIIRDLQEKAKEQKEWAQKKLIDSARRLSKHFMELNRLRMEMEEKEKIKDEILRAEKSRMLKLMEMEQSLRRVHSEACFVTDVIRGLETKNAQLRADTEALKLNGSESDRESKEILKREKKCKKKLSDVEKQISNSRSQCEEEKQRVLQLELELLQAKKEAEKTEVKWRQEIKEKEDMFALVAEEIRMSEIQKANSRAELSKLRQKVDVDNQLDRDECRRLEDELSRLRISQQMADVNVNLRYDDAEPTTSSSEPNARAESSERRVGHWMCMMCLQNEVSVVLLPCTHQVLCFPCYERNCSKTVGAKCPYCNVGIEESIRVFGPS